MNLYPATCVPFFRMRTVVFNQLHASASGPRAKRVAEYRDPYTNGGINLESFGGTTRRGGGEPPSNRQQNQIPSLSAAPEAGVP